MKTRSGFVVSAGAPGGLSCADARDVDVAASPSTSRAPTMADLKFMSTCVLESRIWVLDVRSRMQVAVVRRFPLARAAQQDTLGVTVRGSRGTKCLYSVMECGRDSRKI